MTRLWELMVVKQIGVTWVDGEREGYNGERVVKDRRRGEKGFKSRRVSKDKVEERKKERGENGREEKENEKLLLVAMYICVI